MLLKLTRLDDRRYETEITRSDGVTFHVKGVGHMGALPHDLSHYVVEQGLGIRGGFWGSISAGAVFGSLTHVSGRRKPRASERSRAVLKDNKGALTETEILVGIFDQALQQGLRPDSPQLRENLRRYTWTAPGRVPRQFTDAEIEATCTEMWRMRERWQQLPIGGTLDLVWADPDEVRGKRR